MITCMGLLGVLFSAFYVRIVNRRPTLLVGVAACGLARLAQAVAWTVSPNSAQSGKMVVAFIALFTFFYVAYGMPSTQRYRPKLIACSTLCLASRRRVPQHRASRLRLRRRHSLELPWEVAAHLHRTVLHQPFGSELGL